MTDWDKNHKSSGGPEYHEPVISIGMAAEKVGLSASALRKYENEGLLILHRTESGRRLLSQADIKRIEIIHHLIQKLGLNIEGIRRLLAILPCWKLKPCDEKDRDNCPAYLDSVQPCWMLKNSVCTAAGHDCRACNVYRYGAYFTEDIKTLLHGDTPDK